MKTEKGIMVVMGKYKITDKYFLSHEEAENWMNQTDWISILNVVTIMLLNKKENGKD